MSFKKTYLKSKPVCKVTFKLSKEEAKNAQKVRVVGDFNEWNLSASPMKKLKNGGFSSTIDLPKGAEYQFRYLLDDHEWENDWHADAYITSPVSFDDNSVVSV
ncbi:isoamylase early set domain-containing protein [Aliiglaciecola sp. LCG003]|uniref:isoamylase early set domain-containing protein n=1 Tax=Aliiglaciecola sp. LCG003 TaxID=3053655 RepID=UPI0025723BBD|nr:isoamylase early set domain-containing protein [Aliiglaciecola sp. LCG003]WJG11060.1 isoamylase early set domain-containing protein [Aliiglaciecola sp. LCG003]